VPSRTRFTALIRGILLLWGWEEISINKEVRRLCRIGKSRKEAREKQERGVCVCVSSAFLDCLLCTRWHSTIDPHVQNYPYIASLPYFYKQVPLPQSCLVRILSGQINDLGRKSSPLSRSNFSELSLLYQHRPTLYQLTSRSFTLAASTAL